MVSAMNSNDFELDRMTDIIEGKAQSKVVVSGGTGVSVLNGDGGNCSSSDLIGSEENRVSGADVDSYDKNRAPGSDDDGRFSGGVNNLENTGYEKTRVSDVDLEGVGVEMQSGTSDTGNEDLTREVSDHKFSSRNSGFKQWGSGVEDVGVYSDEKGLVQVDPRASDHKVDVWNGGAGHLGRGRVELAESSVSYYESTISMFDEFVEHWKGNVEGAGLSTSVGFGYEIGDMVWGKVKSHPWWPGHVYNEAFASPAVRRTKRAGHVLVAFFGDSSYGWFDPAELVPFDSNFSEKSRQQTSRIFFKAMGEAVDEASRRRGLGLACRCRNPNNYRPTTVQGYFVVDVDDYEPGAVYSMSQIRKARESFQPRNTLAFMKQLALMPINDEHGTIDFIKNKATVFAYRKSAFEEFDETYAQAFGKQPVRPSRAPIEALAQPVRAPLSGPLVIAESLEKRKHSTKSGRANNHGRSDIYIFKRRDEVNETKIQIGQMVTTGMGGAAASSWDATSEEAVTTESKAEPKIEPPATCADCFLASKAPVYTSHFLEQKPYIDKGKGVLLEAKERTGYNAIVDSSIMDSSGLSGKGAFRGKIDHVSHVLKEGEVTINLKHDRQTATASKLVEGFRQPPDLASIVEEEHGQEEVYSGGSAHVLPATNAKFYGQDSIMQIDTGAKKAKLFKRPVGELGAEKSVPGDKKKKRKKELDMEISSDRMQKQAATGKGGASMGTVTEKPVQVGLPPKEYFQIDHQKKDDVASSSLLPDSLGTRQMVGMGNVFKLQRLLGDLQALALNPFHGVERNSPAIILHTFLKFRSHVYQKSLALSIPAEMVSNEVHASKSPAGSTAGSDNPPRENIKNLPYSKPPKSLVRSDDPTKGGWKRGPSDRQEELTAKRLKKISDMKSLAADKKAAQKTSEAQRDGKERVVPRRLKLLKADSIKKTGSLSRAPEPTMLTMKFPPRTKLPSGSELKARLARFGPLDPSSTRVYWDSSSCRVVFIHRVDAEAAHRHLLGKNTLFGNVNIRCHIRPLPESETKVQREDAPMETLQLRDSAVEQRQPASAAPVHPPAPQRIQLEAGQLKSSLKKPVGDEAGTVTGDYNSHVKSNKFMLVVGGKGEEQLRVVGNMNNFNNASFADGGVSSSSHGMDFNSTNFEKFIPPPPSPIPPRLHAAAQLPNSPNNLHPLLIPSLLPATAQIPHIPNTLRYTEAVAPRNTGNFNTHRATALPRSTNIDIAQQMLSLLTKCNDVVSNVQSFLGYVPYHPL